MARFSDTAAADLTLGDIVPGSSGAHAEFTPRLTIQTPWMRLLSRAVWEENRTTLTLDPPEEFAAWLGDVEDRVRAGLGEWVEAFGSSVSERGWRINLQPSTPVIGPPLERGGHVAVLLEVIGAWLWKERAGLKVKVLQVKHVQASEEESPPEDTGCCFGVTAAGTERPTQTDQAAGCCLGTSTAPQAARA